MNSHLKFHHVGIAARRPEPASAFVRALGYEIGEPVFDPEQNVHLAMCYHKSEPALELIWPGNNKGPIDALVERFTSGIVYHTCYETTNLAAALANLENQGIKAICVSPPKQAILFSGRRVSFYNVLGMGLIEIIE